MHARLKNTTERFGAAAVVLHWSVAVVALVQFAAGLYMVGLEYHHPLYHTLPALHKSIGVAFALLLIARIVWSALNPRPAPARGVRAWEHRIARAVQIAMNALLVFVVVCGYFLATAKGDGIMVFNLFEVAAQPMQYPNQEDIAGALHHWLAVAVMSLAGLHALAALKHHFINRDATLLRMLGKHKSTDS